MKNNKGFTLVEILAMLVILGLLMAVAIPNISGILNNNRKNAYRSDATNMVDTAKIKVAKGNVKKPAQGKCVIMTLAYLDQAENIVEGPYGGDYLPYYSFVILRRKDNKYEYYARLVEQIKENSYYGIALGTVTEINQEGSESVNKINEADLYDLEHATLDSLAGGLTPLCPAGSITYFYK